MLNHAPEVARLLHREHVERLAHAARRALPAAPAAAAREPAPRKRRVRIAYRHLRARV